MWWPVFSWILVSSCVVAWFFVVFGDVYLFFLPVFSWIFVSSCVVAWFFVDFGEFLCGCLFFRGFW